jgi:hypothetical protein
VTAGGKVADLFPGLDFAFEHRADIDCLPFPQFLFLSSRADKSPAGLYNIADSSSSQVME